MNKATFQSYVDQGFNRVPLTRNIFSDLDNALSVFLKLANTPYSYLFESVQGGEKWGRYSIIGLPAKTLIKVRNHDIEVIDNGVSTLLQDVKDPLEWINDYQNAIRVPEIQDLPRFSGGLVGYFGYEIIRYIEPKLADINKPDPIGAPDILLMLSEEVLVFDNLTNNLFLIVHAEENGYDAALERLSTIEEQLKQSLEMPVSNAPSVDITESDFESGFTEAGFKDAVQTAKNYTASGDIMQVVLSQRLSIPFKAPAIDLYRALRSVNPSPYMYYLNLGDFYIVGSSPEILVRKEDNTVTVRPIAGTRKRGDTPKRDKELETELLNDPKELAEHLMLIDLGRNDAGRISKTGSVELTNKMTIERYSHVMHIVSNVIGELRDDVDAMDVLRATFPAGTVSGAPKIRAMEIIDELEPVKRGVYSGAIGYLAWNGNMDTAIAIRTAVVKDETLHIQAGAGIVYDSLPELEWKETMNKARAIFHAASIAAAGLNKATK
ncbi:MAG: Anthranilate synthase, aminase component (EC [uncultured Thiotrichaceae bacterium]|uniref:Anthranilate synthase component 1 n=1 Tax=uncultured Thiotrichaceae bacterium TaxID=298394 RepID=A0A6S6UK42_9GAMM|nr:MAG: Anthranilate synthase, aminase component (EC [uncultured Thiotrichaceae bacterium]